MKKLLLFTALFISAVFVANAQWVEQATGFSTASRGLNNISIVDANTVWAVAYDGSGAGANVQEFTKTIDGGATWTPGTIDVGNTTLGIAMIHAVSATTAYVVAFTNGAGTQGIYQTTDGGANWTRQTTADYQSAASFANVVYFWDANNGFCMGDPIGTPAEYELYTTTDGGTTWTAVPGADIPDPVSGEYGYTGQYAVSGSSIWFTTNKGRIYHSTDMGYTWAVYDSPIADFGSGGNPAFKDANNGLLVDPNANYWTTNDAGATWTAFTPNGPAYGFEVKYVPGSISTYVSTGSADGASFSLYNGSVWEDFTGITGYQMMTSSWLDESTGWAAGFNADATTGGIYKYTGTFPTLLNDDLGVVNIINPVSGAALTNAENVQIEIMNFGINTQSNFDVSYSINGGTTVTETVAAAINGGDTYVYTFTATEDLSTVGFHNIVAATNLTGDENTANDTLSYDFTLMHFQPKKAVVYEEGTGTWCQWCPRGLVGLKDMAHYYNDSTWIGIAVHNFDPMVLTEHDDAISSAISGYPSGLMDRGANEVDPGLATLESAYANKVLEIPYAKIEITAQSWNAATREITLDVTSTFAIDIAVNYNMAAIVIENGVTGTTSDYDQANTYSSASSNIDLIDWEGINYKFKPDPIPAADMVYNHVSRALLGGFNGVGGDIPANAVYNTPYTHSFTYTLPVEYDENNIELVGLIIDNTTGEIINGVQVALDASVNVATFDNVNIKLYPNPTTGQFVIVNAENYSIEVYNTLGQKVVNVENATSMETIDLSAYEAGNYIIRITNSENVITRKINLIK